MITPETQIPDCRFCTANATSSQPKAVVAENQLHDIQLPPFDGAECEQDAASRQQLDRQVESTTDDCSTTDTVFQLKRIIARAYLIGNTGMCMVTGAITGFAYQLTQAHCFECWTTRLLPFALIACGGGYLCRVFDSIRVSSVTRLREMTSRNSQVETPRSSPAIDASPEKSLNGFHEIKDSDIP